MDRPNLLLITTDQQRYDAMGLNGNSIIQTQNMDSLARAGVNFSRAYTTCPSCIAARRTILTGQRPETHGMVGYQDGVEFNPRFTLPGLLGDAGYQTQLVGKFHMYPQRKRFGFDHLVLSETPAYRPNSAFFSQNDYADFVLEHCGVSPEAHGLDGNGRLARPFHLEEQYHHTSWVAAEAIKFLTKRRDPSCPFFMHMSFWAPHPPLIPPQAYFDRYKDDERLAPQIGQWVTKRPPVKGVPPNSGVGPFSADEIQNAMAGYYGLINHVDDCIAHVLSRVFEIGTSRAKEQLWIIFTSDHGVMLGDHHLFRKTLPYEGSAHVPFFISGRNVELPGKPSEELACLEDILPTLCDLAGVAVPDGVDGRSLAPLLRGEAPTKREDLFGEHSGPGANHFLVSGRHKYIWFAKTHEEQIFDLQNDPHELQDLSEDRNLLEPFRKKMAAHLKGRKDYTYDPARLAPLNNGVPRAFWP